MLDNLNVFKYKDPHKELKTILDNHRKRSYPLSSIKYEKGTCAWCGYISRLKYCGDDCKGSAYLYCIPQSPESKIFHLLRQHMACKLCGLDYSDFLNKKYLAAERRRKRLIEDYSGIESLKSIVEDLKEDSISLYQIGYGTGDTIQVDHIIPIFMGGQSLGVENIQILCKPCHKQKTTMERLVKT